MRNRRLKSIALFSGPFFLLLLLLFSTQIYALTGRLSTTRQTKTMAGMCSGIATRFVHYRSCSSAAHQHASHSRMNGKAGHNDKRHFETDLFAGANKAGAPAASQALTSE